MTKRVDWAKVWFRISCAGFIFALGFVLSAYRLFPYSVVRQAAHAVRQVYSERETLARIRPKELTRLARYPGNGVTINKPGAQPGLTLIASFFPDGDNEMRLVRMDGTVLNRWPVRFFDIFPSPQHVDSVFRPQREWQVHTHGLVAFPDGSIVFNFEGAGAARLDRCGAVIWAVPRMTHHSVEPSGDGGFWIPGRDMVRNNSPIPLLKPPYIHDLIFKVAPNGQIIEEISVIDILLRNKLGAFLFTNGLPGVLLPTNDGYGADPTHLNDVEELTPELAPKFPQFRAGDLLLSLRNLNMVVVVDPATRRVKWHQVGPWLKQHDPDFLPSGRIGVLNNNDDGTPRGTVSGGSTLVEVDPVTRRTSIRYGGRSEEHWFTSFRGRQQYLQNGNVLITDSESGRFIEVSPAREILWEYVSRYDDQYVAVVRDALRLPENYFTVNDWTCHAR